MIYVDEERCNGCGDCLSVCEKGAIVLKSGSAWIDNKLCNQCEVCLSQCKTGAIILLEVLDSTTTIETTKQTRITSQPNSQLSISQSISSLIKPALSATLFWAGSELLPHLGTVVKEWLFKPRQATIQSSSTNQIFREHDRSADSGRKRIRQRYGRKRK